MIETGSVSGMRVLVVEDDYVIAMALARGLEEKGAHVIGQAADVEDARKLVETEPVDAVVLDLNLSGRSAANLADYLRVREIPFVLATGYQLEAIPPGLLDVPRCEKPFSACDIAKAIVGVRPRR